MVIDRFEGTYDWLSNFYLTQVEYEGAWYPSSEHAYQAAKTLNLAERVPFQSSNVSSAAAKKMGRRLTMRTDWDQVKLQVMETILRSKFKQDSELAYKLVDTSPSELIEGNWWHDTYWGVCNRVGQNHLGKLLMKLRTELHQIHGYRGPGGLYYAEPYNGN